MPAAESADDLATRLDATCRVTGTFRLRSGRAAGEYFDKYLFESDPGLLREVVDRMATLVPEDVDMLAGLELGGIPIATLLGQVTGLPVLFVRKKAKDYGTRRLVEGGDPAGRRVLVVEDVVSSGGAVIAAATALREIRADVVGARCAIDREEGGAAGLAASGVRLLSAFTRSDLQAARAAPG